MEAYRFDQTPKRSQDPFDFIFIRHMAHGLKYKSRPEIELPVSPRKDMSKFLPLHIQRLDNWTIGHIEFLEAFCQEKIILF